MTKLSAQDVVYLGRFGQESDKENCSYYVVGKLNADKKYDDSVKSFYCKTNSIRSKEYYRNGEAQGTHFYFFSNGKLESVQEFRDGSKTVERKFYANGKPKAVLNHEGTLPFGTAYLVQSTWDSLGKPGVVNMNGNYKLPSKYFFDKLGIESGKIKNGLRDSTWEMRDHWSSKLICRENFSAGNFLRGEAFLENGEKVTYTQIEESASPQGGLPKFYKHISSNLKYPKEARKAKIQGKVFIEFVIARDGSIENVKCFRGIGGGCDEEAVRVIQSASAWIPGRQRGFPVRQKMVMPINFALP